MLEIIIIVYLLSEFMLALFDKFNIIDKFQKLSSKLSSRFIYNLSNCLFCIHFHLSTVLFILVSFFIEFNIMYVLVPFCCSGLKKIIDGIKN